MHQPARAGLVAVGAGIVMILGLDVAYLGQVNPLRRTISEHGLGEQGWVFGLGVALLAAGSLAIAVSLVRRRLAGVVGTIALLGWSLGLLVTAYFPKHDWSVGREGLAWWQVMLLGLVERGLAVTEVAALIALGTWASQRPSQPASIPLDSPAR